jgi:hypothetical protein
LNVLGVAVDIGTDRRCLPDNVAGACVAALLLVLFALLKF